VVLLWFREEKRRGGDSIWFVAALDAEGEEGTTRVRFWGLGLLFKLWTGEDFPALPLCPVWYGDTKKMTT
jgi:hypothetical protein